MDRKAARSVLVVVALALGLFAGWQLRDLSPAANAAEDLDALARTQVERFYDATSGKVSLAQILGEGFQLIRSDGTVYERSGYLKNPASLRTYKLDGFKATRAGDTLIVTFFASFSGKIEGVSYEVTRSPRLAVFTRSDGDWKLQAFANIGLGSAAGSEAEARKAVDAWVAAVANGEKKRIASVIAPEFQIARADGSAYGAADYLESGLPKISGTPAVENLVATGYGDLMVVRYALNIDMKVSGKAVIGHAPRLTVFRRSEGLWLVVAHANFAALKE
jgi:hypothetical protein